jgi:hypothetical protein
MSNKREKIKGVIGTIIYHLLVLSALLFFGLTTPLPLPGEEGVEVNLGNSDQGSGVIQQTIPEEVSQIPEKKEEVVEKKQEEKVVELPPEKPIVKEKIVEEKIIQQETEEAPAIIKPEKKKEEVKEEKTVPIVNPNALYKKKEPVEKPVEKVPEPVVNTNISDINLRRLAREAALQAKFSEDPSAPDLQRGTITYNFIRIN